MFALHASVKRRRSDARTSLGGRRKVEEEEEEKEKEEEEKGMGDHHRNDRSDGLGRPSTTRDLPDVAGMNESALIPLCTIRRKGSDM